MKINVRTIAAVVALAGAPAALVAQRGDAPQAGQQGGWQRGPGRGHQGRGGFQALLNRRQQLGLTDAQVSRLQAISSQLEQRNAPLMERMRTAYQQAGLPAFRGGRDGQANGQRAEGQARGQRQRGERPQLTAEQRQKFQQLRQQLQPVREQMRQNQQQAMRDAQAVLTPAQREQVQQWMQQRQQRAGNREGRGQGRRGQRQHQQGQDSTIRS